MIVHFASTGKNFPYPYYLAVLSAKKVLSPDEIIIWTTTVPEGSIYWEKVRRIADIAKVKTPDLPFLDQFEQWQQDSIVADYLRFDRLYEYGGIYLDLDTFTIRDFTHLLEDYELVLSRESPEGSSECEAHILMAVPHCEYLRKARDDVVRRLDKGFHVIGRHIYRHFRWPDTGPRNISNAVKHAPPNKVRKCPHEWFENYPCGTSVEFEEGNTEIPEFLYLIHYHTACNREIVNGITPEWIRKSTSLYATAVKRVLSEDEWG